MSVDQQTESVQQVGEMQKNKTTFTKIRITEFKGNTYLDIRDFFISKDNKVVPTRKGISIHKSRVTDLISLLEKAEAQLSGVQNETK